MKRKESEIVLCKLGQSDIILFAQSMLNCLENLKEALQGPRFFEALARMSSRLTLDKVMPSR